MIRGRAWKFGDNVDTDQIIPAEYLVTGDAALLAKHAFEKMRPEFAKEVRKGDIIVAGKNFGCGSSREHAPRALLGSGISCVIAKSFARIFFRNSINIGLLVIECDVDVENGEKLEVFFNRGTIKNLKTGAKYEFQPMPEFLMELLSSGLQEYTRRQLRSNRKYL